MRFIFIYFTSIQFNKKFKNNISPKFNSKDYSKFFISDQFNSKFNSKLWNWLDSIQQNIHSIWKCGYRSGLGVGDSLSHVRVDSNWGQDWEEDVSPRQPWSLRQLWSCGNLSQPGWDSAHGGGLPAWVGVWVNFQNTSGIDNRPIKKISRKGWQNIWTPGHQPCPGSSPRKAGEEVEHSIPGRQVDHWHIADMIKIIHHWHLAHKRYISE